MDQLINCIYFKGGDDGAGGLVTDYYETAPSIALWGRHALRWVDGRITVAATMDTFATSYLDKYDSPIYTSYLSVLDNNGEESNKGYDIEDLKPGDVIKMRNFYSNKTTSLWDIMVWDVDVWDYFITDTVGVPTQILKLDYTPDRVTIEASNL